MIFRKMHNQNKTGGPDHLDILLMDSVDSLK